ncbi:MAG: nucleotidyltransferase domain-containing protein [Methanobrevibacter sp.]|uniref:nucleotidyltransferase domain-containing protein n=1 Tax=Methanobrevibacter sp. TaxID=66852 RepID=UPI0025F1384D|nr:nucleotidyltransferase domain-containing protein [Methanobrevibacter sp.]MBQ8017279.1 nucleotidyltransferase domain-containing protein [Methanobrevibacter sp.]
MRDKIVKILGEIEKNEDIEILYACEAGSRVWGFANENSDYDVRFIYKKRDIKSYLSLNQPRDVIEYECDDLDIVGWDIKKALNLHYKNNPNLREWLVSPEVYINRGIQSIFSGLGGFDIIVLKNHYASMGMKHWKKYSSLEFREEKIKKYLYVIRSILTWMLLNRDMYPPIKIQELLEHDLININEDIKKAIYELIDYHQDNGEINEYTILKLNSFIMDSLSKMKTVKVNSFKSLEDYDERFRELLVVCR